jgi:ribose/xylose/arabinose/galactoside ABC-type transport system permease subunit
MFNANPITASAFGLELLLKPAVALVLIALAQMFIVGGSEIDLGAGAFAALVSVLAATILPGSTVLGLACIALALAAYAGVGFLIQWRQIPAIVVTLGASFIWLGVGLSIQPTPGGSVAAWTQTLFRWRIPGIPTSILLICLFAAIAIWINRTPLGVALRGFGNNAQAMVQSGWSPLLAAVLRYTIAGGFLVIAGLVLTAMNSASDINSGTSYTLISVAAVVMGGASLIGGAISPPGAVVGAVTLALIGALLGMLSIPSNLNPATQGLLLLAILAVRSLLEREGGSPMRTLQDFAQSNRWLWAAVAVALLWVVLAAVSGRWSVASLSGIVLSASFLTCVALGQMLVVTTGRGNIDLSVAGVLTQSAFLALVVVQGQDARIWLGVLAAFGLGAGVGLLNAALVIWLRIPAIIATLATGYILASATLMTNAANFGPRMVAPTLRWVASGKVGGVPVFAMVTLAVVIVVALVLRHTVYGRRLSAIGQSRDAARLSGMPVRPRPDRGLRGERHPRRAHRAGARRLCGGRVSRDGTALPAPVGRCGGAWRHPDHGRPRNGGGDMVRGHPPDPHGHDHADPEPAARDAGSPAGRGRHPRPCPRSARPIPRPRGPFPRLTARRIAGGKGRGEEARPLVPPSEAVRAGLRSSSPGEDHRVERAEEVDEHCPRIGMERRDRMTAGVGPDHAALGHRRLGRAEAALAVFVVDRREDARVGRRRPGLVALGPGGEHGLDEVGDHRAGHRPRRARVEVGEERDRLFPVERPLDRVAALGDQRAELRRRLRAFDLEELHHLDLARPCARAASRAGDLEDADAGTSR